MQEEKSGTMVATEQGSYYYHPDHLGSSSVVTDKAGKFYEQLEYFPYGETWIHNKADTEQESVPYKFTAKELDVETGLYYYGARYYDPKLSRWIAVDPPLSRGDYLPKPTDFDSEHSVIWHTLHDKTNKLPGHGGIFRSINLDAYHYAGNNPVVFYDPDGNVDINFFNGLIPSENFIYNAAEKVVSPKNIYTVGGHGNPDKGVYNKFGLPMTPKQLAKEIRNDKKNYKPGMTVRLMSCNTGLSPSSGGDSYGQQLANELGAKVQAPNNLVWYYADGTSIVAPRLSNDKTSPNYKLPDTTKIGKYIEYSPVKKK